MRRDDDGVFADLPAPAVPPGRRASAERIVAQHVVIGAGVGLVPAPGVGFGGGLAVDALMLARLARLYGQQLTRSDVNAWLAALASSVGASLVGAGIGGFFGRIALPLSMAGFSYALGRLFVDHLEGGGRIEAFDPLRDVAQLRRLSRRGGRFVRAFATGAQPAGATAN
ncbi:MAG: DUF697 domain-containing protein [Azoarcus sp.]|nr:DUF697 domain-containing protein [Azoarcus sp.]